MPVDDIDGRVVGDTDMVRLDADDGAQLLVELVDGEIPVSPSAYEEEP